MNVSFLPSNNDDLSMDPVLINVNADGKRVRAMIDWSTIAQMTGVDRVDAVGARDFVDRHRAAIETAIKARLYAEGIPLNGVLVVGRSDLDDVPR